MIDLKKTIALLSNITVDFIVPKLHEKYNIYIPEGFDTWVQEVLDPEAELYTQALDAVVVILDGTESRSWKNMDEGMDRINLWKDALNVLVSKVSVPIFITSICFRCNRIRTFTEYNNRYTLEYSWCQFINDLMSNTNNVYLFDLADTIAEIGIRQFYSDKFWYLSNMPYSKEGLDCLLFEIERLLNTLFSERRKIIVLDLDNTLWGGVIGEDGLEGIELSNHKEGQRYYDFQRQLFEMKKRGLLLGLNSKNNYDDAMIAIQNHPYMILRDDDFAVKRINWNDKTDNMLEMIQEVNLSESSFIFIDDNPVERELIKMVCPDVLVPDFPLDTTELLQFGESIWLDYCRPLRTVEEDLLKTKMYQNQTIRKQLLNRVLNINDYYTQLQMELDIHRMKEYEINRVVQLLNKTNQFNLTTKRYTRTDILQFFASQSKEIYVVYCSDKYGESGLIGVIILELFEASAFIDTFVLSCRVMNRRIEDAFINEIVNRCKGRIILAEYIPTKKNTVVKELYDRLGFELIDTIDGHKMYKLDTNTYEIHIIDTFKEISFSD